MHRGSCGASARSRDWSEVVSKWLGQCGEAAWRYMMLILVGKSKLGKSELGRALQNARGDLLC